MLAQISTWSQSFFMQKLTNFSLIVLLYFSFIHKSIRIGFMEAKRKRLKELTPSFNIENSLHNSIESKYTTTTKTATTAAVAAAMEKNKNNNMIKWQQYEDLNENNNNCPLKELPLVFRIYTYISHCMLVYMFAKYIFLNLTYLEYFDSLKKQHSCYWPGRTYILGELLPSFSMVVLCHHVVYRCYLCLYKRSFIIDCFILVFYDRKTIVEKELKLKKHQKEVEKSYYSLYLNDGFFYLKSVNNNGISGQNPLHLKCNRTERHWLKMRKFLSNFILLVILSCALWGLALGTWVLLNLFSEQYFYSNYNHCLNFALKLQQHFDNFYYHSMRPEVELKTTLSPFPSSSSFTSNESTNIGQLSSFNVFRLITLFLDSLDSAWLLFDTSNALVWPFASLIVIAQDATYSLETLIESSKNLSQYLHQLPLEIYNNNNGKYCNYNDFKLNLKFETGKLLEKIERKTSILQNEIVDLFKQINQSDEFVSKLSAFTIYVWVITNVYYEAVSIYQQGTLGPNSVVQFMQITAFATLTITFALLARTHSRTIKLYKVVCNIVALDPNFHTTKADWMWVLEFFNRKHSRYTFHLGPSDELSMTSYLKSISWFVTVSCVVLNLAHQTLDLTAHRDNSFGSSRS